MLTCAQGSGLVNNFSHLIRQFDPCDRNRLVFHGFLYPVVVGHLAWSSDYGTIQMVVSLIMVFSLTCGTLVFVRVARGTRSLTLLDSVMVASAIPALATLILGHSGRAETLGIPILLLGFLALLSIRQDWHGLILGATLGLLAGTHPMGCILAALLTGIVVFSRMGYVKGFRCLIASGITAVAVFGATFMFFPYSIGDWLSGLTLNGRNVLPKSEGMNASMLYQWFTNTRATGYGMIFGLGFIILLSKFRNHWRKIPAKLLAAACIVPITGAIYNYGIRGPAQNYNLLLFAPLLIVLIIWQFTKTEQMFGIRSRSLKILAITVFGVASVGFVRTVIIFPYFFTSCLSRKSACLQLSSIMERYPGTVGLTSGLFTLTTSYTNIDEVELGRPKESTLHLVRAIDVPWNQVELESAGQNTLIVQQVYRGLSAPPPIAGYRLVENAFTSSKPSFLGLELSTKFGGYNFAVYRREEAGSGL